MAYQLFNDRPLPEPMLHCYSLEPKEHIFLDFQLWKWVYDEYYVLQNAGQFIQASIY